MNGVLNINKPAGITSHDVVQQVRRKLNEKRVGHTGTLDPAATGVLVLCVGKATRIARYLEAGDKEYKATMRLGITTDTLDADGRVLETRSYVPPDRTRVLAALRRFTGTVLQCPPAYSAVKIRGVPSYKLARQGKAEPLAPRTVTIHSIDLDGFEDPRIDLTIACSKGVYIRTLCADIGEELGTGAHLTRLVRTRSGRFFLEDALTIDQLDSCRPDGGGILIPVEEALRDVPAVVVGAPDSRKIAHGNRISRPGDFAEKEAGLVRVHDEAGRFLALARVQEGALIPEVVF